MKTFNLREITTIKRTAMNVNPLVSKKNKIKEKIDNLNEEYNALQELQDTWELAIKQLTGGFTTEDLIDKVVEDTGKVDKEGRPIKITKYVLKYPETVIPVEQELRGISPEEIGEVEVETVEIPVNSTNNIDIN